MDSRLYGELLALALIITGSIGAIVKALTDRLVRDLAANTALTRETKEASNGRLKEALEQLATERNRVFGLRTLLRERDDRLQYLRARLPEIDRVLQGYRERRQEHHTPADELAAEQRIIADGDVDDPTGGDAGAHPEG